MEHYGFFETIYRDLTSGTGQFRLLVQPTIALIFGIRAGRADARAGHPPFGQRLAAGHELRGKLFMSSIKAVLPALVLAFVLDMVVQWMTLGRVRPLVSIIVAAILVWIPFSLIRGITNRISRQRPRPRRTASA